jgi:hypothetical protein
MKYTGMDSKLSPFPDRSSRLGFHYFPDTLHYRESDLQFWLPELTALDISWLVLQSPPDRAIPEYFVSGLVQAGIEPIIQYSLPLLSPPDPQDVRSILTAYAHWGVHGVVWFDRPNTWKSWTSCGWAQQDLVERFLDRFLPYANASIQSGLTPLLPPLEPGGSYWDTSFLRTTLQSLDRRKQYTLLENLVLSAYAWTGGHSLNWGAGGPAHWPAARPYGLFASRPKGEEETSEDHRGFRIFDWYQAVSEAVVGRKYPVILFGGGTHQDPLDWNPELVDDVLHAQTTLAIARTLAGETVPDPLEPDKDLQMIPAGVAACNFWLLSASPESPYRAQAWFRDRERIPAVEALRKWVASRKRQNNRPIVRFAEDRPASAPTRAPEKKYPIDHYLLLPTYDFGVADWHLNIIQPFVKKYRPTVGFSLEEAALAARVTVIGSQQSIPEDVLDSWRNAGSVVERIHGDGTTIATILAER